jgi:hypothetical protein
MSSGSARKATGGRAGGNDLPRSFVAWGNEGEAKLRYFFNISDGTTVLEMTRESFATLDDAKAAAAVGAAELAADAGQYRGFEIHLTDEAGNDVARVPIEG